MATPTIRQVVGNTGTSNSTSVTTTSATAVGDLIVAINQTAFRSGSTGMANAPAGTAPISGTPANGWTPIASVASSSGSLVGVGAWCVRVTTAGAKILASAPSGASGNTNSLIVFVIPGGEPTLTPVDSTPATASGAASTAQALGAVTTTSTDSLLIGSWGSYSTADYTGAPSGMSMAAGSGAETNLSANNAHMAASQALTASGSTGTRTPAGGNTGTSNQSWAGILFAIRGPVVVTTLRRFYLTNAAPAVTPNVSSSSWDDNTAAPTPKRLSSAPEGVSASRAIAETSTVQNYAVLLGQWVSGPASGAGIIDGALAVTAGFLESDAAANLLLSAAIWVRTPANTLRGDITTWNFSGEYPTSAAAITGSGTQTQKAFESGDRLVVEVGYRANNTVATSYTGTMWRGGTGTPDLVAAATDMNRPGWFEVEVTDGISFAADPPVVDVGPNVTGHFAGTAFTRTATELGTGGASITARAWTIQAGPTGVGTTIGTAAALNWTPTVPGSYTLRYTATNAAGPGFDELTIEVLGAPVEAAVGVETVQVQTPPVGVHFETGIRPGVEQVLVENLPVGVAHILPPPDTPDQVVVEALPVEMARRVPVGIDTVEVETLPAKTAGTGIALQTVIVTALPVTVSYGSTGPGGQSGLVAVPPAPATRFIVQNILTGQFLHWDLPLSDPTITLALSGPTQIQGSLDPEDPQIRDLLASGLEPWSCWVHVETDGEIRASGILTPWQVDNEALSIEVVGPSGYPHGLPYLAELSAIGADPADIVRAIWEHLQSYPDGGLGVTVLGSTPVRIGEEEPEEGVEYEEGERPAGPYRLSWWEGTDCGSEIDQLARETPFDYVERCRWNDDRTAVVHWIELGYPRVGARRTDLRFATGENVTGVVPVEETDDLYASQVVVYGKGEGRDTVRGYAGRRLRNRLRRVAILQDKTIPDGQRADALAAMDIERRQGLTDVTDLEVEARHPNAEWGTYQVGDDVPVDVEVAWFGRLVQFERLLSVTYTPDGERVRLQLRRADAFRYGEGA